MKHASLISYQGTAGEHSDMFRSVLSAGKLCWQIQQPKESSHFLIKDVLKRDIFEI